VSTLEGVVLAHQGGWDEILMVAAPVALFGFVLWLANRRAKAQYEARHVEDSSQGADDRPAA
jgi:predicted MFS family arabinose efflux permease